MFLGNWSSRMSRARVPRGEEGQEESGVGRGEVRARSSRGRKADEQCSSMAAVGWNQKDWGCSVGNQNWRMLAIEGSSFAAPATFPGRGWAV